jgi:microcystin-dependent protein
MSDHFLGQILMAGFNFAPRYFARCDGQLLAISQNQALFSLLGTQYGGNGVTTFALPDLRGRAPLGYASSVDPGWQPSNVQIGQLGGVETVTLLASQLPAHVHMANGTTANGTTRNPNNAVYANTSSALHGPATGPQVTLHPSTVANAGGTQPHPNMQPYTAINFCIALQGIFPSRN